MQNFWSLPPKIGHRGAAGSAPENTLSSFKKAKELGAQWVEFDVKETEDGVLILMHDDTLERTTDGQGALINTAWSTVKTLDAGSWFSPAFQGEKVPTFLETCEYLSFLGLGANIEIKPCPGRERQTALKVLEATQKHWPKNLPPPLISSFSRESLEVCYAAQKEFYLGVLFEDIPADWQNFALKLRAKTINVNEEFLTQELAQALIKQGYSIVVYTVNTAQRAQELLSWGVHCLISDFPERIP